MSQQYLRKGTLIVSTGESGLDLSTLRFTFHITASDVQTPNVCIARVYNVADATEAKVRAQYTALTIQAGYENGNYGVIFQGTIKQFRSGRENPVDTYLDILAADGDLAYNWGTVGATLAAGSTPQQRFNTLLGSPTDTGIAAGSVDLPAGGTLPRGKVLFGMFRDGMRDLARSTGTTWSIQNGKVNVIPLTGYLPGEAVELNAATGMVGMPEQTNEGIKIRCLLNPRLKVGGLVKINNKDIIQALHQIDNTTNYLTSDQYAALKFIARVTDDGIYRIYVIEYEGDTRGTPWYCDLICLSVDATAPIDMSVQAGGPGGS